MSKCRVQQCYTPASLQETHDDMELFMQMNKLSDNGDWSDLEGFEERKETTMICEIENTEDADQTNTLKCVVYIFLLASPH